MTYTPTPTTAATPPVRKARTVRTALAQEEDDDPVLTVHEVAVKLRVDDTTVRRWIKSGALAAITLPGKGRRQAYRIRKSTVDAGLAAGLEGWQS